MSSDLELMEACLAGNRQAFGRIVERYQSLICAVAYSATGDLGVSEDLAQETFVTAWKRLGELRDRTKLRAWLCGIARNLTNNWIRQRSRDIVARAEPLERSSETTATAPTPREHAISKEEEAILWSALEQIPETCREPLILYYREQQSVQQVAEALEISEDAVKQRLSRGRKMLKEQVAAFVEETLGRTGPKKAFTVAVLAAIPAAAPKVAAAGVAATAATGAGLAGGLLGTIGGFLGGVIGALASIINTKSPRERRFMVKMNCIVFAYVLTYMAILCTLLILIKSYPRGPVLAVYVVVTAVYFVGLIRLVFWSNRRQRQIQIEDGTYVERRVQPVTISKPALYASLGGAIFGSVSWLFVMAFVAKDWIVAAAVMVAAAGILAIGTKTCLRAPEMYYRILMRVCSGLAALNLAVVNMRWHTWMVFYRQSPRYDHWNDLPLWVLNLVIAGLFVFLFCLFFLKDRQQRAMLQSGQD
jgi:RNA polymerase sigma factor (sigma-70 family)